MTILMSNPPSLKYFHNPTIPQTSSAITTTTTLTRTTSSHKSSRVTITTNVLKKSNSSTCYCPCCARRNFLGAVLGTGLFTFPVLPSFASTDVNSSSHDPTSMLNSVHPPRPDWYEEFYASAMDKTMKSYEAEVEKILEIGIGTGPNIKYYADYPGMEVVGVDPNRKMEKYAHAAAEAAGLPLSNFKFMQAVAESLPLNDSSVDVVVGTLVLCSVKDVDRTLQEVKRVLRPGGFYVFVEHVAAKDGTVLRFVQGILDPLQQTLADGCHLTRTSATSIARAGFTSININSAVLSTASLINPHVYGIAQN